MNEAEFKSRTKAVAVRVIKLADALHRGRSGDALARQIIRSGTSIGANYRSACRGRSVNDVISRLGIVEDEADETLFWMEVIVESGLLPAKRLTSLMDEVNQILAMTVASIRTMRAKASRNRANPKSKIQNPKSTYA